MKTLLCFLIFSAVALAQPYNCTSNGTGGGVWKTNTTWNNCGGGYPGQTSCNDTASIAYTDTVTHNDICVKQLMIQGGTLRFDASKPSYVLINSTGSTWQTDMWGIGVCGFYDATHGHLDWSAATLTNYIIVDSYDGVHPFAVGNYSGTPCTAYGDPQIQLGSVVFTPRCGLSGSVPCITSNVTDQGHLGSSANGAVFNGSYLPLFGFVTVTNTVFYNTTGPMIQTGGGYSQVPSTASLNRSNNVALNPADNSRMVLDTYQPDSPATDTLNYNAYFDTATNTPGGHVGPFTFGATYTNTPGKVSGSYDVVGGVNANSDCLALPFSKANVTNSFDHWTCDGAAEMYASNLTTLVNTSYMRLTSGTVNGSWQGILAAPYGGTYYTSSHDSAVERGSNSGSLGMLTIDSSTYVTMDHDTVIQTLPDAANGAGFQWGEGSGAGLAATFSQNTNSINVGSTNGIAPQNSNSTFVTSGAGCTAAVGVCNNNAPTVPAVLPVYHGCLNTTGCRAAGNTTPYLTSVFGAGYDDGTHVHPNVIYGDKTSVPVFLDPFRGLPKYDFLAGGPGTMANVANCMAVYRNPLVSLIGIVCIGNPNLYDPKLLWKFMDAGIKPVTVNLASAANDGTYIGATSPLVMGSWAM